MAWVFAELKEHEVRFIVLTFAAGWRSPNALSIKKNSDGVHCPGERVGFAREFFLEDPSQFYRRRSPTVCLTRSSW